MIYRVLAALIFDEEDEAKDAYHDLMLCLAKAITLHPGTDLEEHSVIAWHTCTHTDPVEGPCILTASDQSP